MKRIKLISVLAVLLTMGTSADAQNTDSTASLFTTKGSRVNSVVGSFTNQKQEGKESTTSFSVGVSFLTFVTTGFAAGADINFTGISSGRTTATLFGFGPKFIGALSIPETFVYPYLGVGYNYIAAGGSGSGGGGHMIKGALGMIFEVNNHLGIPVEFAIGFPVGKDSDFKIHGLNIGIVILSY